MSVRKILLVVNPTCAKYTKPQLRGYVLLDSLLFLIPTRSFYLQVEGQTVNLERFFNANMRSQLKNIEEPLMHDGE